MRKLIAVLALACVTTLAHAGEVNAYQSLEPQQTFAKGDGQGVAYSYVKRDKTQFVTLLRNKQQGKKEMRVPCEVLVRQMAEVHGLPFEGCEGAAAAIEHDNEYSVVACRDEMFKKENYLVVTNPFGTTFGRWHRACLSNEHVLAYKGRPVISLTCLNVVVPAKVPAHVTSAPPMVGSNPPPEEPKVALPGRCPDVYTLKVNVWRSDALKLPGVEQTHAEEELANRFTGVEHVSRKHGRQIREGYAAGLTGRSVLLRKFQVSLIMTPEAHGGKPEITDEKEVRVVSVIGVRELGFSRSDLEKWDAIRVVALDGDGIVSPPRSGQTSQHEIRFFNHLPGIFGWLSLSNLGEWDNNPDKDCIMNEHWIELSK